MSLCYRRAFRISWLTLGLQTDELFLNLVLEYIPETVYRVARNYAKQKQSMPILLVKVRFTSLSGFSPICDRINHPKGHSHVLF